MVGVSAETICRCWNKAHLRLEGPVEPFWLANGNPRYELGQVYESIRVQLRAIPSVPFLNQQDLRDFVAPPEEYAPQRQTNLTIEEIAASAPCDLPDGIDPQAPLDRSEPRPLITKTEINHALEVLLFRPPPVLQHYQKYQP